MEGARKWTVAVVSIVIVIVLVLAAVAYLMLRKDEEEPKGSVVDIIGPDISTSELIDHGSGTHSDPYVITGLNISVRSVPNWANVYGMTIAHVDAHLAISGAVIRSEEPTIPSQPMWGIRMTDCTNITIVDCDFDDFQIGINLVACERIDIDGNHFEKCVYGVQLELEGDDHIISVVNNTFERCTYGVYSYRGSSQLSISENSFLDGECAFRGMHTDDITINNNTAKLMVGVIFEIDTCEKMSMMGNNLSLNFGGGLNLFAASNVTALNNIIDRKVSISACSLVNISQNSIGWISVRSSTSVVLSGNDIHTVGATGIWLMDSKGVNITWNRIWECDVGIQLLSSGSTSSSVVVHHNDFISNGIQALDNGGTQNTWDDGVGEGNYWSGFGVDNNHDGIADFPYEIDEDSEDRYPLMESVY